MNEVYRQVTAILYAIWQRRVYALITAWLVAAFGWFFVAQIPNKYEATARIYVDTQSMLGNIMRGMAVNTDILQQLNMVRQTLVSRPNMEKVVRMTDLDLNARTDAELDALITDLQMRLKLNSSGVNLFRLSYEDVDPQLARRVVQSLLTLFVEANIGASRKDLAGTRRFLDDQIRKHEQELIAAERRKAEFQQKNMGFLPGSTGYFTRVQELRGELVMANAALEEARVQRDEMQRHIAETPPYITATGGVAGPPIGGTLSDYPSRIAGTQRRLDELKERGYTDKHPDVVILQERIDTLTKEHEQEQATLAERMENGDFAGMAGNGNVVPNPLFEQLKLRVIDMETQIATLANRVEQKRDDVTRLESMAQRVPEVEAELARLNRDYNVIKGNYEKLLQRRESARLAQDLETKSDGVQIRVVDPPELPRVPSSPNRLLLLSGVLVVAIGAGVAVAFLLSQLHTTYSNVQKLRDSFSFPVLGCISAIVTVQERRLQLRNIMAFGIGLIGLFGAFIGVVMIEIMRGNLYVV